MAQPLPAFSSLLVGNLPEPKKPHGGDQLLRNGGWMRYVMFKPFTETIGNDGIWKEDEGFQTFPYSDKIVGGKEHLAVTMFRGTADWFYLYKYKLDESTSVNLIFEYNASKKIFTKVTSI